jgi:hypothetical protein
MLVSPTGSSSQSWSAGGRLHPISRGADLVTVPAGSTLWMVGTDVDASARSCVDSSDVICIVAFVERDGATIRRTAGWRALSTDSTDEVLATVHRGTPFPAGCRDHCLSAWVLILNGNSSYRQFSVSLR